MAKMLDFTKAKKPTIPIKLPDETILHIYGPTKAMLEELLDLDNVLEKAVDNDKESIDALYDFVARCMSHNKLGQKITSEMLEGMEFDVSDLIRFAHGYAGFIAELKTAKN